MWIKRERAREGGVKINVTVSSSATVCYRTTTNPCRFGDAQLVNSPVMQVYTAERDSPGKTAEKEHSGSLH